MTAAFAPMQLCGRCRLSKPATAFYPSTKTKSKWCKACMKEYSAERYRKMNPSGATGRDGTLPPDEPRAARPVRVRVANFTRDDTPAELRALAFGEEIARRCSLPWVALYVITSEWVRRSEMSRRAARLAP